MEKKLYKISRDFDLPETNQKCNVVGSKIVCDKHSNY